MANENSCPICGKPVEPNALNGLCPECLLKGAIPTDAGSMSGDPEKSKTAAFVPPTPEELAKKFPQLEILELLGRGGMGAVYKARQKSLGRTVALKILPPGIGDERTFAQRFAHEARALASLNHPNIVVLYEFGEADGLFFFLMEYVDGVTLRQLLNTRQVSPREALAIVPQICDALQYAHDQGIVHRDIKPENILMDRRGRVKVADFGLAKLVGTERGSASRSALREESAQETSAAGNRPALHDLTEAGKTMGTPQYMAPEQLTNPTEVDHRADIYALGVVFYQMLTGELPGKRIEPPSKKVHIDVRLDEIVLRALEKDPERRYEQASVLKTQVETIADTSNHRTDSSKPSAANFTVPPYASGYEYKSKRRWFGLPLLHVATGVDPKTGEARKARGIVALGGIATGWLAVGGRAYGGIAFGGIAVGGIAFGGLAAGIFSFGGLVLALALAIGGLAIAPVAIGGLAIGYLAIGGQAFGFHLYDARQHDPETFPKFYHEIQPRLFAIMGAIWVGSLGIYFVITKWAKRQILMRHTAKTDPEVSGTDAAKSGIKSRRRRKVLWNIVIAVAIAVILRTFAIGIYYATTDAVSPEVPRGSRVLVWKLTRSFEPGDVIVYKKNNRNLLGRVAAELYHENQRVRDRVLVERQGDLLTEILASDIIGKVIFNTRSSILPKSEGLKVNAPPFVANYDGGSIELIAIAPHPSTNAQAWLPNGAPATERFPSDNGHSWAAGKVMREMAFKVRSRTGEAGSPVFKVISPFDFNEMGLSQSGNGAERAGRLCIQDLACPPEAKEMDVQIGIADGAWENVLALEVNGEKVSGGTEQSGEGGRWEANFQGIASKSGEVAISFNFIRRTEWETRLVAVKTDGKVVSLESGYREASGDLWHGMMSFSKEEFADLKDFQLQRRKYQWTEFRNVSLVPGHRTTVEIRNAPETTWKKQATAPSPSQKLGTTDSETQFGPVIKQVVPDSSTKRDFFIDFDTGQLHTPPSDLKLNTLQAQQAWMRSNGIDAFGQTSANVRGLVGADLMARRIPNPSWDSLSANDAKKDEAFVKGGDGSSVFLRGSPESTNTFLFKTDDGGIGILQITGFTQNPPGVKIRYKLAQSAITRSQNKSAKPIPPEAALALKEWATFFKSKSVREMSDPSVQAEIQRLQKGFAGLLSGTIAQPLWDRLEQVSKATQQAYSQGKDEQFRRLMEEQNELGVQLMALVGVSGKDDEPPTFGHVIEQVLPDPDNGSGKGNRETLNLRTGERSSILDDAPKKQGGRLLALVTSQGDLFAEYDDYVSKSWALVTANLRLSDFPARQWNSASAPEIADALKEPTVLQKQEHSGATLYLLPENFVPLTLAFETREGARGLLQITKFEDNPRSLKIRYKLLAKTSEANATLKPIPPRAAELLKEIQTLYQRRYASNSPDSDKKFRTQLSALEKELESVLAGTAAEPLLKQQKEEMLKMQEATRAKDKAKIKEATDRLQAIGSKMVELINPDVLRSGGNSARPKTTIESTGSMKEKNTSAVESPKRSDSTASKQENEFSFSHREKLGQSVLDAARDFVEEHQWKLNGERGGTTNGITSVTIEAFDLNGKRVAFEDAPQTNGASRFTVRVESGSEFSADRIGTAIARRLGLAAGWPGDAARNYSATWSERFAALNKKDWQAAFAIGQTVAALPPDDGFELLKKNWSSVTNVDARQQLLKAFDFAAHERLLDVLELGLSDPSPAVQKWAAGYAAGISLQYEGTNYIAAKNWIAARRGKTLENAFNDGVREATQLLRDWKGKDRHAQLQFMRLNASLFRKFPNAAKKAGLDELLVEFANGSDEQTKNLTLELAAAADFGGDWYRRLNLPDLSRKNLKPDRDPETDALRKMSVIEIVTAIQTCVTRIEKAREAGLLLEMESTFNQINEYCDQLQGKNKNTAPSAKDWKVDADTHQKILKLLAEIENAAEGMRSIASDRKMPDAERIGMIRRVWNEKFAKNYADFKATVSSNQK